jgi:hypothetical protein
MTHSELVVLAHNEQGFMQVGKFRLPGPLLIENILMKLITNAQRCLSSPNQCQALLS